MRLVLPITMLALLAACGTPHQPAPIVDRTSRPESRAVTSSGPRQMDSHGNYTVKKGDTLFQISQDFGQNVRDLVSWNNLASANDIQVGQLLRVAPAGAAAAPVAASAPAAGAPSAGSAAIPAIEVRPLNAPPSASVAANVAAVPHKNAPRGDKQPYSEAVLAELQKPESVATVSAPAQMAVKQPEKPAEKPAEKLIEKPAVAAINEEDAGISWIWPADGKIVGSFDGGKKGIDIGGKIGQPVMAAAGGKVMYALGSRTRRSSP